MTELGGIIVLPEHQNRTDLPSMLEVFKQHNRFAWGEMSEEELGNNRINPSEIRHFGAEVFEFFDPDRTLHFRSRLSTLHQQPRKRLAFATGPIKDTVLLHFITIDPLYSSSEKGRKGLRALLDIWQGKCNCSPGQELPKEVRKIMRVLPEWPVVIRQTGGRLHEFAWEYDSKSKEYEKKIGVDPIYEIFQIGWTDDDLAPYLMDG